MDFFDRLNRKAIDFYLNFANAIRRRNPDDDGRPIGFGKCESLVRRMASALGYDVVVKRLSKSCYGWFVSFAAENGDGEYVILVNGRNCGRKKIMAHGPVTLIGADPFEAFLAKMCEGRLPFLRSDAARESLLRCSSAEELELRLVGEGI